LSDELKRRFAWWANTFVRAVPTKAGGLGAECAVGLAVPAGTGLALFGVFLYSQAKRKFKDKPKAA
jgi:hypothetical protein